MRGKRIIILTVLVFMIILSGGCIEENKEDNKQEDKHEVKKEKMVYVGKGEKVDANTFLKLFETDTTTYKFKKKKDNKEKELENNKLTWTKDDESKKKFDNLKEGETYTVEYYKDKLESVVIEDKKGKKWVNGW